MSKWTSAATILLVSGFATTASAQTRYVAAPWTFVGTAAECSPAPAGSKIVTSSWQPGTGLPDNGTANPDGKDAHQGLLLSKNGPTANCSAAGATIEGWTPGQPLSALGFDYRKGGHCGAGAPRFNVTSGTTTYFFGCAAGTHSTAPQDPSEWERVTFTSSTEGFPPTFVFGVTPVDSIEIVFDEGTDSTSSEDANGVGLAVLDNIRINNTIIRNKKGAIITP